jgi:hypothetical protein
MKFYTPFEITAAGAVVAFFVDSGLAVEPAEAVSTLVQHSNCRISLLALALSWVRLARKLKTSCSGNCRADKLIACLLLEGVRDNSDRPRRVRLWSRERVKTRLMNISRRTRVQRRTSYRHYSGDRVNGAAFAPSSGRSGCTCRDFPRSR